MRTKDWCCTVCGKLFAELEELEVHEREHAAFAPFPIPLTLRAGYCPFCDHAPCRCADGRPAPPAALAPEELLRLGALTLKAEESQAIERLLEEQEATYEAVLRDQGPRALIVALVARDRLLANQGRQIADGRTVSRLAKEMLRSALYQQGGRPDVAGVERALTQFGSESSDARQLKLHGSTLGPLKSPEAEAEKLADGRLVAKPGATVSGGALVKGEGR